MLVAHTKAQEEERMKRINSMDLEKDQIYAYLVMGSRTPQNDWERQVVKEINEIKAKGGIVEIPFN